MDGELLRPEDLANLWVEDRTTPYHIALVGEFEAGSWTVDGGRPDLDRVRTQLAARVHRVPPLGRRMVGRRLGLARPQWRPDPAFRPEDHIRCSVLPAGADFPQWAADRIVEPLDRDRPLWRADVVGLAGDRVGLVVVVHHAVSDGLTGVVLITRLLDERPGMTAADAPRSPLPTPSTAGAPPDGGGARRRRRGLSGVRAILHEFAGRADRTSLPRRIGPTRRLTVVDESLDDLRRVGHALGATVNDVLLAAVAGGMRMLLDARGELRPDMVLRVSVPVGRAGAGQTAGMLAVALPVGEDDPVARVTAISRDTAAAKARLAGGGGHVMDVLSLPVPLARVVVRFMRRIAGRRINLFVTDVPGPAEPLWLDGARLERAVPVAPLVQGVPLGVSALSYAGRFAVAANADASIGDLDRFADGMRADFASMRLSAGGQTPAGGQGPPAAYEAPLSTGRT